MPCYCFFLLLRLGSTRGRVFPNSWFMRGLSATHSSFQEATLPAIFAPASRVFEALARQKLPGWQPATSCLDPREGHSCPLVCTRTAEVYSIRYGNASIFLRKNKLFLRYFCALVCCWNVSIQDMGSKRKSRFSGPALSWPAIP